MFDLENMKASQWYGTRECLQVNESSDGADSCDVSGQK